MCTVPASLECCCDSLCLAAPQCFQLGPSPFLLNLTILEIRRCGTRAPPSPSGSSEALARSLSMGTFSCPPSSRFASCTSLLAVRARATSSPTLCCSLLFCPYSVRRSGSFALSAHTFDLLCHVPCVMTPCGAPTLNSCYSSKCSSFSSLTVESTFGISSTLHSRLAFCAGHYSWAVVCCHQRSFSDLRRCCYSWSFYASAVSCFGRGG